MVRRQSGDRRFKTTAIAIGVGQPRIYAMTETRDTTRQAAELAALRRMLVASRGCFSLSFAVCDDRGLRNELVRRLCEDFPGISTVALDPGTPDVYRVVRDRLLGTQPEAVFVLDLEASVPFQAEDYPTLRALNSSRELWEPLSCPVVFWLASYAAALVAGQAPDFWRYRSHQFEFVADPKPLSEAISDLSVEFDLEDALPFEEKLFRIAELEERLQEAGREPSNEILPHALKWVYELAHLYRHSNRFGEAEEWLRRALQWAEKSYGSSAPRTAIALNNLAQLLKATNRLQEAEPLIRRALAIDEQSFGPEHPDVARDLNNLATVLHITNRLEEAEPLIRRALEIAEERHGPEHPNVATCLNNLASLLQVTNRLQDAEPMSRRALAIDERSHGPEHPNVARDLNNLASLLVTTSRLQEAEPLIRRALAIDEQSFGPEHPDVARDLNNLASLLGITNRLLEAESLSRRSLAMLLDVTRRTGHPHPNLDAALANYKAILKQRGRSDAEIEADIRALQERPEESASNRNSSS
ncbi:MAG: tetratricopeptide repeat protein [Gammaproteobacteria bacterium]|nr:tetratricopeptide repeat protein [Gammaproteobacteria bacterium]